MAALLKLIAVLSLNILASGSYVIDLSDGVGRRFDGIGGLSGGGSTSKLLVSYPPNLRSEILDYLFKPNFGASLQIIKVEIGGDAQSTDGTESSHMHEPWDENYHRGYEWWLLTEAKKRNPDIKVYGLAWAFPGWVGKGTGDPYKFPNITANYIYKWVVGAARYYNILVDYVGIWNERNYDITFVKVLKSVLAQDVLTAHIQIVAADDSWDVSRDILKDPSFADAVDIIGCHYPGTYTTSASLKTGKPLWSSEDYSTFNDNVGAGCWARILNQNYVNGYMTSTISWNLIASYYPQLPFGGDGLMTAYEPWSGHYVVESPIWITAHTTQFTSIGWNYLRHGSGVQKLDHGGSFVTLTDESREHITIIIETMTHNHSVCIRPSLPEYTVVAQQADFQLKGSLSKIETLMVWKSKLGFDGKSTKLFEQQPSLPLLYGSFSLNLYPDEVYTLTTLVVGQHGSYSVPPPSKPFPLPYRDDFEKYHTGEEADNYAPQAGVWEVRQTADSKHSKVNRQVILNDPIYWCDTGNATINIGGDYKWTDIQVQADVFVPSVNGSTGIFTAARVDRGGCDVKYATGIFFVLYPDNGTYTVTTDLPQQFVITSGLCNVTYDEWYGMTLNIKHNQVDGFLGSKQLFSISVLDIATNGFTGYGTIGYGYGDFDNWGVLPLSYDNNCPLNGPSCKKTQVGWHQKKHTFSYAPFYEDIVQHL